MEDGVKKGLLKVVSYKTGGIKLEGSDEWLNPCKEIKVKLQDFMENIKPLYGKDVLVEVLKDKPTYYTSIILDQPQSTTTKGHKPQPVSRDVLIVRQNSGSQAVGLLEVMGNQGLLKEMSINEIQVLFYQLSESFESWVLRK